MINEKLYDDILNENKKNIFKGNLLTWIFTILFLLFFMWSFFNIFGAFQGMANNWEQNINYIFQGMLHPNIELLFDMSFSKGIIPNVTTTLCIAILGTTIGFLIALPMAIKASDNLNEKNSSKYKKIFALLRTIPALVIALMMVIAVGPNAFAGTLAIAISSIGMLGKMISEVIEEMDMGIVEALESSGATKNQIILRGIIPYIFTNLISITLYRLDINVRESITIGMVGAGGMGTPIILALQSQNWPSIFMWTYVTIIMVVTIEFISSSYRKKIR